MAWLRHRRFYIAFRSILALSYVILFATQVSGKFYFYASSKTLALIAKQQPAVRSAVAAYLADPFFDSKHNKAGSLDKRYNYEHVAAFVSSEIKLPARLNTSQHEFFAHQQYIIPHFVASATMRGPPAFVLA